MKNKIAILALIGALCCLGPVSSAYAEMCPFCDKKGMGAGDCGKKIEQMDFEDLLYWKAKFMLSNSSRVGLSTDQEDQIVAVKMATKKSMAMKNAEIEVLKLNLMEELKKDPANLETINGLIDQKYELKKAKAKELAAAFVDLCTIPSKEQKAELKKKWMSGMADQE
ncbi:MAG: hypothetical protein ACOY3K_00265 [Candidatus Omnitrophota bacterium]